MAAIPSFPSRCIAIIALGAFSIASGCNDREVPRTQSGEPIPFDHLATLPSGHPPIPADAGPGQRNANPPAQSQAALPARSIRVTVRLSPALASKAAPGDTVLLAPACSSFDMFKDYAARGRAFKDEVGRLRGVPTRG